MSNVLIATLGESPIVVTSMVRALREKEGISTDILYVIYPQEEGLIPLGFDLIKDHLQGQCEVYPCTLPFPDANSYESSMQFLQTLSELMEHYERSDDVVYLSMAGGRKNMSALMAVICQFFNCVRGLYHILDKYEDYENKRNFYSIEALFDFSENVRNEKLSPPVENLILVKIPYQRFSNATELRRFFSAEQRETFAIEIDAEVDDFFSAIFQRRKTKLLDVYLSEEAYQQYQELGGGYTRKQLKNCLRSMCSPQSLNSHIHPLPGAKMDCKCFKMGSTDERPFYYQTDGEVVVCKVLRHGGQEYQEIANGQRELLQKLSFFPFIQSLIGRISMLALFHCDSSLDLDFSSFLDQAKTISVENDSLNWQTWLRYSGKQKRRMNWGGLVGELDFVGEISQFLPYIRLGEYIHVGKSATFGLGQYKVSGEW
jgi:CRISPR-associated Csx14 family protein